MPVECGGIEYPAKLSTVLVTMVVGTVVVLLLARLDHLAPIICTWSI